VIGTFPNRVILRRVASSGCGLPRSFRTQAWLGHGQPCPECRVCAAVLQFVPVFYCYRERGRVVKRDCVTVPDIPDMPGNTTRPQPPAAPRPGTCSMITSTSPRYPRRSTRDHDPQPTSRHEAGTVCTLTGGISSRCHGFSTFTVPQQPKSEPDCAIGLAGRGPGRERRARRLAAGSEARRKPGQNAISSARYRKLRLIRNATIA
jgi:hypothetical protein